MILELNAVCRTNVCTDDIAIEDSCPTLRPC